MSGVAFIILFFFGFAVGDLCELSVQKHNAYRKIHHAPELKCNETISESAQAFADKIAITCSWDVRRDGMKYGENKGMYGYSNGYYDPETVIERSVENWYEQADCYDYDNAEANNEACINTNKCTKKGCKVGVFTQIVWKGTKEMGVGVANCKERDEGYYYTVVVIDYYPAGNMMGSFEKNVLKP